jgi:NAD(P)-dependent dehydrogenase (short-subunit alcohol dehydrogenase family)
MSAESADARKVAVVVGVGPGLGRSVALRFAREGYAIALMSRGTDKLQPVEAEIREGGGEAKSIACDATRPDAVAGAFAAAREALGPADVLVYNAGAFQMSGILETTPEQFETCWKANCFGGFLSAQQVLPGMLVKGRGTIIFTGATASLRGSARFANLAVGKFGLRAVAQSTAREFGPRGIHVAHVIIDGQIDTPRLRQMQPDREGHTILSPDAIAETYWQLHSQDPTAWTLELDLRPSVEKF